MEQDPYSISKLQNEEIDEPKKPISKVPMEVICVNNIGLEEHFDQDVEYVSEAHKEDEMIWVHNRFGEKVECFAERFEKVANA